MKFFKVLYIVGAVVLLFGAAARMFMPEYYAYVYLTGAVLFALAQFMLRPRNTSLTLRRLVVQQQLAGVLFIAAGVAMFVCGSNEWILLLTCGALIELYTAYRIPAELEKQK